MSSASTATLTPRPDTSFYRPPKNSAPPTPGLKCSASTASLPDVMCLVVRVAGQRGDRRGAQRGWRSHQHLSHLRPTWEIQLQTNVIQTGPRSAIQPGRLLGAAQARGPSGSHHSHSCTNPGPGTKPHPSSYPSTGTGADPRSGSCSTSCPAGISETSRSTAPDSTPDGAASPPASALLPTAPLDRFRGRPIWPLAPSATSPRSNSSSCSFCNYCSHTLCFIRVLVSHPTATRHQGVSDTTTDTTAKGHSGKLRDAPTFKWGPFCFTSGSRSLAKILVGANHDTCSPETAT